MEDFEKDFPDFDWKNIPAYKHPKGKDCPCPKHEFIREQINISKNLNNNHNNNSSSVQDYSKYSRKAQITLKLCPDHYNVYFKEVIPSMPLKYKLMTKVAIKLGAVVIQQISYMLSDQCFYCRFGSGGFDRKTELPPI